MAVAAVFSTSTVKVSTSLWSSLHQVPELGNLVEAICWLVQTGAYQVWGMKRSK